MKIYDFHCTHLYRGDDDIEDRPQSVARRSLAGIGPESRPIYATHHQIVERKGVVIMNLLGASSGQVFHALTIASQYHNGLFRKSEPIPAIVHPVAVALIVAMHKRDPDIISAALLHDTLEDTAYTATMMEADFGSRVLHLVNGVSVLKSECNGQATWRERKLIHIDKMANAEFDQMLICGADKTHNLSSLIVSHRTQGDKLWELFNASAQDYHWYYTTILRALSRRFQHPLLDQLGQLIKLAEPIMNQCTDQIS